MDARLAISEHRDLLITTLSPPALEFLYTLLEDENIVYAIIVNHEDLPTASAKIDDLINIVCRRNSTDLADKFLSWLLASNQAELHAAILRGRSQHSPNLSVGDFTTDSVDDGGESPCESLSKETTAVLDMPGVLPNEEFVNEKLADTCAVYPISSRVRGVAMLVINSKFPSRREFDRNGSEFDTNNLHRLFTWLGYEVLVYSNLTKTDLNLKLDTLTRDNKQRSYSSFVLCVLSHGSTGTIVMSDLSEVYIDELLDRLDSNNFPAMAGKPKLIYIDANSQALASDKGFSLPKADESHQISKSPTGPLQPIRVIQSRTVYEKCTIKHKEFSNPVFDAYQAKVACKADFVLLLASFFGYTALHNVAIGSISTRVLVETFYKHAHSHHIVELAMRIRRKKCSRFLRDTTEVLTLIETLTKDFYLFPVSPT
ncbi:caspase-6-like [Watersipora subatra]|uniref:caspase-6-like n=1 Tax=Watersipora subatra TaxID=2589382 RepID=UPI00355BE5FD